jgi:hypothetical protein
MWSQFFLENIHFAINLFAALVFFGVSWLYFDAWIIRKTPLGGARILGFLFLTFSFIFHATYIESSILPVSVIGENLQGIFFPIFQISGLLLIITSLLAEPIQAQPRNAPAKSSSPAFLGLGNAPIFTPMLYGLVGTLYFRRATIGLERHLKPVAIAFYILALSGLFGLSNLARSVDNITLYQLTAPFGPLWIIEHLLLLVAVALISHWVFGYLLKRLMSQIFMFASVTILGIFLITTATFTYLLVKSLEEETLNQLVSDAKVLQYSIDSLSAQSLSDAEVVAKNPQVISALVDKSRQGLGDLTQNVLLSKKESFLTIINGSGQVLARGEDKEHYGDYLASDPLVRRALLGQSATSIETKNGTLAPEISVRAATPINSQGKIIGAVLAGTIIDNAFIDGIEQATGLVGSLYGDDQLSATTIAVGSAHARPIGARETSPIVKEIVLQNGQGYSGAVTFLNLPLYAAYQPLKDIDNVPVGMLMVARPQIGVLAAAGKSIEITFLASALLLVLAAIPSYLVSKYLTSQVT